MVFLTFIEAFFCWKKRFGGKKEFRGFGDFLDSCDKKTKPGMYGVKK